MFNYKRRIVNIISFVCFVLFLLTGFYAGAQTRVISPYSQYGIGELNNNNLSRNLAIGGIGYGYRSNTAVNYLNPASYSSVDTTSFVFEFVGFSHFYQQETTTHEQMSNYSSLGSISFSFPINRNLGIGAGLKPYSHVGHRVLQQVTNENNQTIDFINQGSGGINEVFVGASYQILNGLSIGVNTSYLFGALEYQTITSPVNIPGFKRLYKTETDYVSGLLLNYGLQYERRISETRHFTLGITYSHDTDINISRISLIEDEMPGVLPRSVIYESDEQKGSLIIPKQIGVGSWFKYNNNWSTGFDINWQNWENYQRFDQESENLQDLYKLAVGIKYSPTITTYTGVFANADYMAGVRFGQSHLNIDNYSYDEFGISAGLFLPMRRTRNGINIGFEYSQRGTTDNNRIKEDFYRINIGINIYERWFIKRKFF